MIANKKSLRKVLSAALLGSALAILMAAPHAYAATATQTYDQWRSEQSTTTWPLEVSAHVTGSEEVPSNTSATTGNFYFLENANRTSAPFHLSVYNGHDVTGAHLHCGVAGSNGPVVVTLYDGGATSTNGALAHDTIVDTMIESAAGTCPTPIRNVSELYRAIDIGEVYVNVHTTAYPNGEVRAQLPRPVNAFSGSGSQNYQNYYIDSNSNENQVSGRYLGSDGNWYMWSVGAAGSDPTHNDGSAYGDQDTRGTYDRNSENRTWQGRQKEWRNTDKNKWSSDHRSWGDGSDEADGDDGEEDEWSRGWSDDNSDNSRYDSQDYSRGDRTRSWGSNSSRSTRNDNE